MFLRNSTLSIILFSILLTLSSCANQTREDEIDFTTSFEKSNGLETATYKEVITFYEDLEKRYPSIKIHKMDRTDSGEFLRVVTFNVNRTSASEFDIDRKENIILINNGIHPGESDGIDASMMLLRDYASGKIKAPNNTIIAVIPVYNIGGALNRNSTTRTNQNGPLEYGFRGNARNYDLNRDFIKADTKNAKAFTKLFRLIRPEVFIDNHVSNGADYQYTLTHLFTQHNKLGGELGDYLHTKLMPELEDALKSKDWPITPYVNVFNRTPENGFSQFYDSPRYSTGYTTLYGTLGMMVETHMLKPYKQRVEGTFELLKSMIQITDNDAATIKNLKKNHTNRFSPGNYYPINWKVDTTRQTTLDFLGYEGTMIDSKITGAQRLKYDKTKPFTRKVEYQNYYKAVDSIIIPEKYIIPKGYWNIVDLLKLNQVKMQPIYKDTIITAEIYKIESFETRSNPYEGHYAHYNTKTKTTIENVVVKEGDHVVHTNQEAVCYIIETLEPAAVDSFFNWNFFDTILQQKEGFSPYVWEDKAAQLLEKNPELKATFEAKKVEDASFAKNWYAQLDWLHKQSSNYEKAHLRYPIIRVRR